jgi:hypothetical protein
MEFRGFQDLDVLEEGWESEKLREEGSGRKEEETA